MIELIVMNYLNKKLNIPVFLEEQEIKPNEYIILDKTGSSEEDFISSATIAIQSHANTLYEGACLNERVKKAMNEIVNLNSISMSNLNSDYEYTDTTKKKYRYQAVYNLVYFED